MNYIDDVNSGTSLNEVFENAKDRLKKEVTNQVTPGMSLVESEDLRLILTYVEQMEVFIEDADRAGLF